MWCSTRPTACSTSAFLPDLQRILSYLPKQRTTLLFSATFSPEIKRLAGKLPAGPDHDRSRAPQRNGGHRRAALSTAPGDDDKRRLVRQIAACPPDSNRLSYSSTASSAARAWPAALERDGLNTAAALHGDKSQDERLKALEAFKRGEVDLLVCTDVAARGLDIKDVPAVFNYDVPFNAEDYVHRIGRTGRAGASGLAVTLVTNADATATLIADIEKLIRKKVELEAFEFEEDRPRGRINTGRRAWGGDDPRDAIEETPPPRTVRPTRRSSAPVDPFFSQPYEASEVEATPTWESASRTNAPRPGVSSNIKTKRKVAALFKPGD
jgi:ATP-dependent RNA helicase RhlE